jgi:hypothetical protein
LAFVSSSLDVEGAAVDHEMAGKILSALMEIAEHETGFDVVTTRDRGVVHQDRRSLAALAVEGAGGAYLPGNRVLAAFLHRKAADPDPQVSQAARDALSGTANGLKAD